MFQPERSTIRAILARWLRLLACLAFLPLAIAPLARAQDAAPPAAPPAAAEPAAEPAAEEPAAEEPAEAPAADEPAMEADSEPAMDDAAAEEPAADEAPEEEAADEAKPAPKAKPDKAAAETGPAKPTDPAVLAILESHPTTAAELLRAIAILVDLKHAELAKPYLDELAARKLDLEAKAALADRFHSATLLKLAHNAELAPVLAPLVDDLLKSAEAYRHDPARLTAWAAQLSDPNESVRAQAALALVRAREAAVAPLIQILADPSRVAQRPAAREILLHLNDLAVEPLLGVLESPDAALKTQVVEILGQLRAAKAVAQLLGPSISAQGPPELRAAARRALAEIGGHALDPAEAQRLLEYAARRALAASRQDNAAADSPIALWHWNARRKQSMPLEYDATGASLATTVRLARDLYLLDPTQPANRRLYLTALLQAAKYRGGLGKPLATGPGTAYAVAAHWGADVVEDLLADAMAGGYLAAAAGAAQILGDLGGAELLTRGGSAPSPLAKAAGHADRRLRFAAIAAIMKLNPTEPFPGSSRVAEGLGFFASSYGVPRVLVVHPRSDEGRKIAGLAASMGYEGDVATNGRQAFELATGSPDYEFILIHSAIARPAVDELLAQLRRDRRTALVPVGLIAPLEDLERVKRFARESKMAEAFLQPQNEDEMKLFAGQVLARGSRASVPHDERWAQATAALDWLVALGSKPQHVFDLRRQEPALLQVLYVPELAARATAVLGEVGSVKAERSLIELADQPTQPLAARQAAVTAFARSLRSHGLLLSREMILGQYELYNINAGRDADTHAVLGAILDALEHKNDSRASN